MYCEIAQKKNGPQRSLLANLVIVELNLVLSICQYTWNGRFSYNFKLCFYDYEKRFRNGQCDKAAGSTTSCQHQSVVDPNRGKHPDQGEKGVHLGLNAPTSTAGAPPQRPSGCSCRL